MGKPALPAHAGMSPRAGWNAPPTVTVSTPTSATAPAAAGVPMHGPGSHGPAHDAARAAGGLKLPYQHHQPYYHQPYYQYPYGHPADSLPSPYSPAGSLPSASSNGGYPLAGYYIPAKDYESHAAIVEQHSGAGTPEHKAPTGKPTKDVGSANRQLTHTEAIDRARAVTEYRRNIERVQENSSHIYHFVAKYSPPNPPPHGTIPRTPPPSLSMVEDILARAREIASFLMHWREQVIIEEQSARSSKFAVYDDDSNIIDGLKKGKRRSRSSPPSRCHQCGISETPEWRRGPDGARTLCNACGLHHAKLIKKKGKVAGYGSPADARKAA
ncbi:uncharacterized protein V1510DRAFT_419611 [Dipodascopsis tothii]|uniref:uncharacterized protein n=1 Tax=Dipodascopsis tothii TaxID=44089 RepID=UPI0034CF2163